MTMSADPEFIIRLVQVLDEEPEIVLAFSSMVRINENGESLGVVKRTNATEGSPSTTISLADKQNT